MTDSAAEPAWARADRKFFRRNPRRSHRLRRAFRGEWVDGSTHTVVRQARPGVRVRLPVSLTEHLPQGEDVPEAAAWAIFDLFIEHQARGSDEITVGEIKTRYRRLEAGGSA
jgi:hypothetical protein